MISSYVRAVYLGSVGMLAHGLWREQRQVRLEGRILDRAEHLFAQRPLRGLFLCLVQALRGLDPREFSCATDTLDAPCATLLLRSC